MAAAVCMALAICAGPSWAASSPTKEACASAYEDTQRLERDGKLLKARESAVSCAQAACPTVLRSDCVRWLQDLEAAVPTVVIDVRTHDGAPVRAPEISIDGQVTPLAGSGRAIALDPGEHSVRVTTPGLSLRTQLFAVQGRKNALFVVTLPPPAEPAPSATADEPWSPRQRAALAVAAVGTVSLATAATFGIKGLAHRNDLQQTCGGACGSQERQSLERDFLVADVALGIAAVGAGVAAWLWWGASAATPPASRPPVSAQAKAGGGLLSFQGRF